MRITIHLMVLISLILGIFNSCCNKENQKYDVLRDSIRELKKINNEYKKMFNFQKIRLRAEMENSKINLNDTLRINVFLSANSFYNPVIDKSKKIYFVYQIINEQDYKSIVNIEDINPFFIKNTYTDTIEYLNDDIEITLYKKEKGIYYLRGIMCIPSIDYYGKLHYTRLPMQQEILIK